MQDWRESTVAGMVLRGVIFTCTLLIASESAALANPAPKPSITVLDFELYDLTLTPKTAEELERTASIGPLLRQALETKHGFEHRAIDSERQLSADLAFGYIYDHHDVAAELGRGIGSDWIVVGRVHKASFLFAYLKVKVLNTKTQKLVADLTVEVKGSQTRLTRKGVETLAEQIAEKIRRVPT